MISISGSRCRLFLLILVGLFLSLFASACLWGIVRDADTGQPLSGVTVKYTDMYGQTAATTTNDFGLFAFGAPTSTAPAMGQVNFQIESPGYQTIVEPRTVAYDDNPGATLANLNSFAEAQGFAITRGPGGYHDVIGGFSVTFPEDWDVEGASEGAGVMGSSPAYGSGIQGACTVTTGPYPAGTNLRAFVDDLLSSIKDSQYVSNFRRFGTTSVEVNGMPAIRAVYSYTVKIRTGDMRLEMSAKYVAHFMAEGYQAYAVECFSFIDEFAAAESTFDRVAQSFRLDWAPAASNQ